MYFAYSALVLLCSFSKAEDKLVAISDIRKNADDYNGKYVTVEGIVTYCVGDDSFYIQQTLEEYSSETEDNFQAITVLVDGTTTFESPNDDDEFCLESHKVRVVGKIIPYTEDMNRPYAVIAVIKADSIEYFIGAEEIVAVDLSSKKIPKYLFHYRALSRHNPRREKTEGKKKFREITSITNFRTTSALGFYLSYLGMVVSINDAKIVQVMKEFLWVVPNRGDGQFMNKERTGVILKFDQILEETGIPYDDYATSALLVLTDTHQGHKLGDILEPITGVLHYFDGLFYLLPTNDVEIKEKLHLDRFPTPSIDFYSERLYAISYNCRNMQYSDSADTLVAQLRIMKFPDLIMLQEVKNDNRIWNYINSAINQVGDSSANYKYYTIDSGVKRYSGAFAFGVGYLYNTQRVQFEPLDIDMQPPKKLFSAGKVPTVVKVTFNDQSFYVINIHLSANLSSALYTLARSVRMNNGFRVSQAEYLCQVIDQLNDFPVLLAGDFNAVEVEEPIAILQNCGLSMVPVRGEKYSTLGNGRLSQIDFAFVKGEITAKSDFWRMNTHYAQGLSDHDPLAISLQFTSG